MGAIMAMGRADHQRLHAGQVIPAAPGAWASPQLPQFSGADLERGLGAVKFVSDEFRCSWRSSSRRNWPKSLLGIRVAVADIRNVGTVAQIRAAGEIQP
jgi:hypothetical protein